VMMRMLALLVLVLFPAMAAAQLPSRQQPRNRLQLERQVMERIARQIGDSLQLSPDARTRVEEWLIETNARRRELARETANLRRQLAAGLRDETTGDAEFERLLGELRELRRRELERFQSDERELSQVLTPRQRAQLALRMARLQERMRELMMRRGGN